MIISKKILFELWGKYNIYFILFIIFSPIFISLDFTQGLKFDGYYFNQYLRPSIPISVLVLIVMASISIRPLLRNKQIILLSILIVFYMLLNIYYGTTRAFIVGVGMLLPIISYYSFKNYLLSKENSFFILYKTLFFVILIKFLFDIYLYQMHIYVNNMYTGQVLQETIFSTPFYIHNSMIIYSYYDYFPFIYYLAIVLSFQNLINKVMIKRSLLLIIISLIAIQDTDSRLFIYGIYLIPILYFFYKLTKFRLNSYFYLFMTTSIIITFVIGLLDFTVTDASLSARYSNAHRYFDDFSLKNVFLPFINTHRLEAEGSLHNELLEIFSFFGFVIIYYYYLLRNMFCNVKNEYKLISYLLMFIILTGALIQINISNPYVGIMLGCTLAIITHSKKE